MSSITAEIPDPVLKSMQRIASNEGVPVERLAAIAIAQAVGAWGNQHPVFAARAARASRQRFESALRKVPDVEPENESDR